jgi:sigma-B regulation protein RsbU (phosphoserine phosphatase)
MSELTIPKNPTTAGDDAETLLREVSSLQSQLQAMQSELDLLHRRDAALNGYMQKIDEEMRLAARLQYDFLPKKLPSVGRVRVNALFRPAGYVSGDLYDVMRLDEKHVGFYVADAVGHGMPAALLTMFMKNALVTKEITPSGYRLVPPEQSMNTLNRALCSQNLSQATFATALYGLVNVETLAVTFARGGHPNPLLLHRDGRLEELEADGGLLGIFDDDQFIPGSGVLSPGDRLVIYSDGIEVAFAEDRGVVDTRIWRNELQKRHDLSTDELLNDFARHVDSESGSLMPRDDLTLVVIEAT